MTFEEVAERLRKHGISCGVMAYESGFVAELEGEDDPEAWGRPYYSPACDTLDKAVQHLHAAAKRLYPDTYGKEEA